MLFFGKKRVAGVVINGLVNVDRVFDPESENPQSGLAVAEAVGAVQESISGIEERQDNTTVSINDLYSEFGNLCSQMAGAPTKEYVDDAVAGAGGEKPWELVEDITLTEAVASYEKDLQDKNFKEVYFEAIVLSADTATASQTFDVRVSLGLGVWQGRANFGNGKTYVAGTMSLSPSKTYVCDATASIYGYTVSGTSYRVTGRLDSAAAVGSNTIPKIILQLSGQFAVGTKIKVWGR